MDDEPGYGAVGVVLCKGCSDAVMADARCPTCGKRDPRVAGPERADFREEELLDQVGVALRAQAALAVRVAARRFETASGLFEQAVMLRGRLRRQAMLLRARMAERNELLPDVREALGRVQAAVDSGDRSGRVGAAWTMRVHLPRDRTCPTVARRLLEEYAREELGERDAEQAMIIISELASNALVHGDGTILVSVRRRDDRLRIEVLDEGTPDRIDVVPKAQWGESGRGLWIVEQLATSWGAVAGTGPVWAELALGNVRGGR
jgi:anti-sigma regulatory factor (Ser/Thr protein kinase)